MNKNIEKENKVLPENKSKNLKKITIISGKGGVGKSSITASIAIVLNNILDKENKKNIYIEKQDHKETQQKNDNDINNIICCDCDVDASNLSLVLGVGDSEDNEKDFIEWTSLSTDKIASFDHSKCIGCKICVENCHFGAIKEAEEQREAGEQKKVEERRKIEKQENVEEIEKKLEKKKISQFFPQLKKFTCEGCGVCEIVCPKKAISLIDISNADIGHAVTKYGFKVVSAQLKAGSSGSGKVVTEVKKMADNILNTDKRDYVKQIMLIDSSAGIGCPVIASVSGSDYVVVVTEPSPSGFSDMKKAIKIIEHFEISYGVIINKYDLDKDFSNMIIEYLKENNIEVIGKIPFNRIFPDALNALIPVVLFDKHGETNNKTIKNANNSQIKTIFNEIAEKIYKDIF